MHTPEVYVTHTQLSTTARSSGCRTFNASVWSGEWGGTVVKLRQKSLHGSS